MNATQIIEIKQISKLKLKKNALEEVNKEKEWRKDPKYNTELCKSFEAKGICIYGNKCRFAHGKQELFIKSQNLQNYNEKQCFSFYNNGYCVYGKRCHFMHFEKKLYEISRSFYSFLVSCYSLPFSNESPTVNLDTSPKIPIMFENDSLIIKTSKTSNSPINKSSASTISNDSNKSTFSSKNNSCYSSRRLKIFNDIHIGRVMKNPCQRFTISNHQNYEINCNYQNKVSLIRLGDRSNF